MPSVAAHARKVGVPVHTIYSRMLKMYGLKPWSDYTDEEKQAVTVRQRKRGRPAKRRKGEK